MNGPTSALKRSSEADEGKYRLLLKLGQGGAAEVHLAVARGPGGFNKLVVVKTPRRELVQDPAWRRMFMDEARLSARLIHANIVQTNEIVETTGLPMIVMEYLEGQPLSALFSQEQNETHTMAIYLRVISEMLSGLHYAHECTDFDGTKLNLVHRDMSPQNIFITYDGQVKILDFGIAKLNRSEHRTETGIVKGKLHYMSAEQLAGESIDRRADIYAVGAIVWEIAAGRSLWKGIAERTVMNQVLNGEVPSPLEANPAANPELVRICMKALALEPPQRYATALEMQADIELLLESLELRATARDVGRILTKSFAEEREKNRLVIEEQLSRVAGLSWEDAANADVSDAFDTNARSRARRAKTHSRRRALLVLALLGFVGIVVVLAWRSNKATLETKLIVPSALPTPTPSIAAAPTVSTTIAVPDVVHVHLEALPHTATLFLDNAPLANPYDGTMRKDGTTHFVRAEVRQYLPVTATLVLDKDANLVITLERAPQGGTAKVADAGANNNVRSAQCSPPFYFDAQGIKRFKPECYQ